MRGGEGGGARHFPKVIASTSKLEYLRYKTDICLHELMKEAGCIPKKKASEEIVSTLSLNVNRVG